MNLVLCESCFKQKLLEIVILHVLAYRTYWLVVFLKTVLNNISGAILNYLVE